MATDTNPKQNVTRSGAQASVKAEKTFTGTVRIDPLFGSKEPEAPFNGAYVTFEPGSRCFWHTHPTGQHLVVVSGFGRTGVWGVGVEDLRPGDVVWCPPGVKHWHGASPTTAMTHLALTGADTGGSVMEWLEEVSEEEYLGRK